MNTITGTFSVKMTPEDPWDVDNGVTLGRLRFDKVFSGPLTATSIVQMMAVRTAVADSASYVAVEKIVGTSVIGATLNGTGSLIMRADQVGSATVLSQIVQLVAQAQRATALVEL